MDNNYQLRLPMAHFLKGTLVLILIGWQSVLIAAENAEVPLTEATPESQNLDSALLEQAVAEITEGKYDDYSKDEKHIYGC